MTSTSKPKNRLGAALSGVALEVAPYLAAISAFIAGATVLAAAAMPVFADRILVLNRFAPIFIVEFSHFGASVVGLLLMLVGSGLWRRREGAFWLALVLLLFGALFSLTKGLEYEESVLLVFVAGILWSARHAFDRPSRIFSGTISTVWLTATIAGVTSAGVLGFVAYKNVVYTDELWWRFAADRDASRFLRAGVVVAAATLGVAILTLFSGPGHSRRRPSAEDKARAAAILAADVNAAPNGMIALTGDKDFLFSPSGESFLAYRVRAGRWIALGAPYGPLAEREDLMWRFTEEADRAGGTAVFYSAPPDLLPTLAAMGFILRQVGEQAVVGTEGFSMVGKRRQNLRTACNHAVAEGLTFEVAPAGSATALAGELQAVSEDWMGGQTGGEKGFSMGRFDIGYLDRMPLALVRDREGHVVAFANVLTGGGEAGIDLMRYRHVSHGLMDFLFVRLIEWARDNGYGGLNLGMAPLAGLQNRRLAPVFSRIGALVFTEAGALYSFGGLRAYKAKFDPQWRPLYMGGRPGVVMPLALLDVALLTGGGWRGLIGLSR